MKTEKSSHSKRIFFVLLLSFSLTLTAKAELPATFPERFPELFQQVQLKPVFKDSKKFIDLNPIYQDNQILKNYETSCIQSKCNLRFFIDENFQEPKSKQKEFQTDRSKTLVEHIESLWPVLSREGYKKSNQSKQLIESSLIPLPYRYIVPGGRFNEIYYWDSYFTMLGLQVSKKNQLIRDMVNNFAYLVDEFGFIPNGNRKYFLSRSQPPFFSLMVELLAEIDGSTVYTKYLPQLEKEYKFWMNGENILSSMNKAYRRVIRLDENSILNRYWDDKETPRPEGFKEDLKTAQTSEREAKEVYRDIKAACESGWDFSSRWFSNGKDLTTIQTTQIIPIDLNSLLWNLEKTIAKAHRINGNKSKTNQYEERASKRIFSINYYLWDQNESFFLDYNFYSHKRVKHGKSLASVFPLFFQIASPDQAELIAKEIKRDFLQENGLLTTLNKTEEQWDGNKGWAPLHWITIKGLKNYGFDKLADEIAQKWINNNLSVFCKSGKLVEKYNVVNSESGEGGEYPVQDGFGWTNGVLLKLLYDYNQTQLKCVL
ncbi:MAG: alpha,alpha-trehalase TreF [Candidatus Caenarcaniphilales bacterium]|nr:alpha,alpha-trehalase TreF [Candidatus Caenarcaniphilales bacterium]